MMKNYIASTRQSATSTTLHWVEGRGEAWPLLPSPELWCWHTGTAFTDQHHIRPLHRVPAVSPVLAASHKSGTWVISSYNSRLHGLSSWVIPHQPPPDTGTLEARAQCTTTTTGALNHGNPVLMKISTCFWPRSFFQFVFIQTPKPHQSGEIMGFSVLIFLIGHLVPLRFHSFILELDYNKNWN